MSEKKKNEIGKPQRLKQHLLQQFQELKPEGNAPEDLKEKVFDTLDTVQLLGDLADLFTVKFTQTESVVVGQVGDSVAPESAEEEE